MSKKTVNKKYPYDTLLVTNDPDMFKLAPFNRDLRRSQELENSMIENGPLPIPILCHWVNENDDSDDIEIFDGQHRCQIAKKLKIPLYYVIIKRRPGLDVISLNSSITLWGPEDITSAFKNQGIESYKKIFNYKNELEIPITTTICIFNCGKKHYNKKIYNSGLFKIKEEAEIFSEKVRYILNLMREYGIKCYNSRSIVLAVIRILTLPQFDISVFEKKIKKYYYKFEKRRTLEEAIIMIENIYNYSLRKDAKINLRLLIDTQVDVPAISKTNVSIESAE